MTVMVAEDRSMCIQPCQMVRTGWVDIDLCKLGFRHPMSPEAVEKKFRRLLNIGDCAPWPLVVGHWENGRFLVDDGRHDYLAAQMMGRDKLFVCWLEAAPVAQIEQIEPGSCATQRAGAVGSAAPPLPSRTAGLAHNSLPAWRLGLWSRVWRNRRELAINGEVTDPLRPPAAVRSRL